MNTIEYIWELYLKLKNRGLIINHIFIIISIAFYTANNLAHKTDLFHSTSPRTAGINFPFHCSKYFFREITFIFF